MINYTAILIFVK